MRAWNVDDHLVEIASRDARFEQRRNYIVMDMQVVMVGHGCMIILYSGAVWTGIGAPVPVHGLEAQRHADLG